jgi:hypothetical protein
MIHNLDDLVQYTEQLAIDSPLIAEKVRILRPGCSPDEVALLKNILPGLRAQGAIVSP